MAESLRSAFKSCAVEKKNDVVLRVDQKFNDGAYVTLYYDFALRIMYTSWNGTHITPFSVLDREVLTELRDQLIRMGGKPPELPAEAPATSSPAKKLNL